MVMNKPAELWFRPIYYSTADKAHQCECWDGQIRYVDLLAWQDLPADTDPESMLGKIYWAEDETPHLWVARGVRTIRQIPRREHDKTGELT